MVERNDEQPITAFGRQLDRLEALAIEAKQAGADAKQAAVEAKAEAAKTNGRLLMMEDIFHGYSTRDGQHTGRGLLYKVDEIDQRVEQLTLQTSGFAVAGDTSRRDRTTVIMGLALIISGLTLGAMLLAMVLQ